MIYLSTFARPKGAKDKQKRKRRNSSLAENLAIVSAPSLYANYLLGQAFQVAERNSLEKDIKNKEIGIKERLQWGRSRLNKYSNLINKTTPLTPNQIDHLALLESYKRYPDPQRKGAEILLSDRDIASLEKNQKLLPKLKKKWTRIEKVAVPENWKEGLTIKKKFMTPSRLGVTLLGGAGTTILTGSLLNKLRDNK